MPSSAAPFCPSDLRVQLLARRDAYGGLEEEPDMPAKTRSAFRDQLGAPLYDRTRLLVGTARRGIYALPTTAEAICLGSFPDGGGSVGLPGPHGLRVAFDDDANEASPFRLYGIVGDDVASVEVIVDGGVREAELGQNGYWLVIEDGQREQLEELILRLHGGTTHVLPLRVQHPLR